MEKGTGLGKARLKFYNTLMGTEEPYYDNILKRVLELKIHDLYSDGGDNGIGPSLGNPNPEYHILKMI